MIPLWVDETLELYRLEGNELKLAGSSTLVHASPLLSEVLQVSFRLVAGEPRPQIEMTHGPSQKSWLE